MSDEILLSLTNVRKRFGGIVAVAQLDLDVRTGEILGLIGLNGAGKSTLLRLISGFERPDAGNFIFDHHDISGLPPHKICKQGISITFQIPPAIQHLSVFDLLMVAAHNQSNNTQAVFTKVLGIAEKFRLDTMLHHEIGTIDYASVRRLDFARAIATGCKLLLLDEPFAGQDSNESDYLSSLMNSFRQEGMTIVVADHIIPRLQVLCDRLAFMDVGKVITIGRPSDVLRDKQIRDSYLGDE